MSDEIKIAKAVDTTGKVVVTDDRKVVVMDGFTKWTNKHNGFTVLDVEYKADPAKRSPEWLKDVAAGMPRAEFEREYGSTWIVYDGKPVYADYAESVHCVKGTIHVPRKSKLISGWDGGPNDVNLAWVLGLVVPAVPSVLWIDELYSEDGDIEGFVESVNSRLRMEWAKIAGFSIHVCDPSVFTKTQVVKGGKAMADVMRGFGLFPIPGAISFAKRRQSVENMLVQAARWELGTMVPRWRVHERCIILREAMQGGYAYPKYAGGVGDMYKPMPFKNKFSHPANAMEYACSRITLTASEIPFEGRKLPRMTRV